MTAIRMYLNFRRRGFNRRLSARLSFWWLESNRLYRCAKRAPSLFTTTRP